MYSTISHCDMYCISNIVCTVGCAKRQAARRVGRSCPTLELSLGKTKSDEGTVKRTKKQKKNEERNTY